MTALPLIEALDLRPTTEPASPDIEFVWDWPAAPAASEIPLAVPAEKGALDGSR